jgi:hypothetical protein
MGRLTDDMTRLRGDIDSSRSSRLAQTHETRSSVKAQLADFALTRTRNGQQDSQARANFVSDISKSTSGLLSDFNSDRRNMAEQTSKQRADFISDLSSSTSNLLSDFNSDRRNMAEQTSKQRADFVTNLSNGVSVFINDIATDRADAHAAFFGTVSKKKKNGIALRLINDTPVKTNAGSLSQHESLHTEQAHLAEVIKAQDESQHSEQTELAEVTQSEKEVSLANEIKKPRKPKKHTESE